MERRGVIIKIEAAGRFFPLEVSGTVHANAAGGKWVVAMDAEGVAYSFGQERSKQNILAKKW